MHILRVKLQDGIKAPQLIYYPLIFHTSMTGNRSIHAKQKSIGARLMRVDETYPRVAFLALPAIQC
jgi:hypothetical protein